MTKMLLYTWGTNSESKDVLDMAEVVYNNFGMITTEALSNTSQTTPASLEALENRHKRVFALLKAESIQAVDCLSEYWKMVNDLVRLEVEGREKVVEACVFAEKLMISDHHTDNDTSSAVSQEESERWRQEEKQERGDLSMNLIMLVP
jgi:hypothetical protein